MTTLPAVVRIVDLPVATTITGAELLEVVQTSAGVGLSVQVPISSIMTTALGGLPTGGATGQLLSKTSGTNFASTWSSIISFVGTNATTLATSGSVTSIVITIAAGGVGSTQLAANAVQQSNITANAVGTAQLASSLGIASSLSIGTLLTVAGTATLNGGLVLNGTLGLTGTTLLTGTLGVVGTTLITGTLGQVGTANFTSNSFNVVGTALFTSGAFGVVGTTLMTGRVGVVGTSLLTGAFGVVGTSQFTGLFNVVGTTLFTSGAFGVVGTTNITGIVGVVGSASFSGGTFGVLATTNITGIMSVVGTANFSGGTFGVLATSAFTGGFGVVGTTLVTGIVGIVGTSLLTGVFGQVGTTLHTGAFGVVGTATFTSNLFSVVGTSLMTGQVGLVGTTLVTGVFVLGSQGSGFLQTSATGVVTAGANAGNFVLLNTLSPNNVASTNDTTSFTNTYKTYMITFENVCPATQTTTLQMTVATSGSNFVSGSYVSIVQYIVSGTNVADVSTSVLLLSGARVTTQVQTALSYGVSGFIKYFNPASTVSRKQFVGQLNYLTAGAASTSSMVQVWGASGWYDGAASPVTGVNFAFNSGNIQTGTIKIYGIT